MENSSDKATKRLKAKDFSKRLADAVRAFPGNQGLERGQQVWLRERLKLLCGLEFSGESVSKWFNGESRPRPETMREIARILEVDESWLALGIAPDSAERELRTHSGLASGPANVIAGLIQMAGGSVAFNEDEGSDMTAIIRGKKVEIEVKTAAVLPDGSLRFVVPKVGEKVVVLGVAPASALSDMRIIRLDAARLAEYGKRRNAGTEVVIAPSEIRRWPVVRSVEQIVA